MQGSHVASSQLESVYEYARAVPLADNHVHSIYRNAPGLREYAECLFLAGDEAMIPELSGTTPGRLLTCEIMPRFAEWSGMQTSGTAFGAYLEQQAALSSTDRRRWTETLLKETGTKTWILDDGCAKNVLLPAGMFAAISHGRVYRSVRLETLGEEALRAIDGEPEAFVAVFRRILSRKSEADSTVAFKSIAAYRTGFGIDWNPTDDSSLIRAVKTAIRQPKPHVDDPLVEAFIVSEALKTGLPIQCHVGFGDSDAILADGDPTLLKPLIDRAAEKCVPVILLHCAPFERQAAWLCSLHRNVYMDLSLTMLHAGNRTQDIIERTLEWCPPAKLVYGSDGIGVPETHAIEASVWRAAVAGVYVKRVKEGLLDIDEACREIDMMSHGTSERLYKLGRHSPIARN